MKELIFYLVVFILVYLFYVIFVLNRKNVLKKFYEGKELRYLKYKYGIKVNDKNLHVIVPTLDFTLTQPRVFDNINLDPKMDMDLKTIALATAAAPTYFPAIEYIWKMQ